MKKLLLLMLLVMTMPMTMMAGDPVEIGGIYYNLIPKGKIATVTSNPNKYTGDIVIPSTVTYNNVVYNVTSIGDYAFEGCTGLTSIDIPDGVTSIGIAAFNNCKGLTSVTIPNSVTSIGNNAFNNCKGLTSIDIPNSVTIIGEGAFSWSNLTSVTIGNGVTSIGVFAFSGCSNLTSVTIGNGVTSIGGSAFDGCTSLTSIDIPNSVTSIGGWAFNGCSSLTSITVNSENSKYDSRNNCNAIIEKSTNTLIAGCKNTIIPTSVTSIGLGAFSGCSSLTSIDIPNSVTSIGDYAFRDCKGLTSVTIGNSVTSIGRCAFYGCSGLTSIDISNSVTSIGKYAFYECSSLTSVTIGSGVTSIGENAFNGCSSLTSIDIPNSVTSIGGSALANCEALEVVTCRATSVPSTNTNAFDGSYVEHATLIVPDEAYTAYSTTSPWSNFGTILKLSETSVITASSYTREYGDANPTFEYTCAVTLNGEPIITCAADETSAPGTYPITISQGTVTNTGLVFVDGTLTVTKAPLTISANSYTIHEGDALPTFEAVYEGLKNNESESVVNPVISCSATDSNTPGTYPITVTASSDNYDITTVAGTLTILPAKMSITIGAPGVGTYCSPYDLDFSTVNDFKAYIATGYNSATGNVIVQAVKDVPAGTGLFLKGTPGTYDVPCGESTSYYVNMLVGVTEATTISATDGNMTNFLLSATDSSDACFRPISSTYNLKANRAYLQIPTSMVSSSAGANSVGIEFEEGVTGIDNSLSDMDTDAHWFTLDGRKLNGKPTQKGIYVVNGRKVVVK